MWDEHASRRSMLSDAAFMSPTELDSILNQIERSNSVWKRPKHWFPCIWVKYTGFFEKSDLGGACGWLENNVPSRTVRSWLEAGDGLTSETMNSPRYGLGNSFPSRWCRRLKYFYVWLKCSRIGFTSLLQRMGNRKRNRLGEPYWKDKEYQIVTL